MMGVLAGLLWAGVLSAQTELVVNTRTDTTQREPRIARDAAERLFNLEGGWLHTVRALSLRPGAAIRHRPADDAHPLADS
jgi:hypothetical protein